MRLTRFCVVDIKKERIVFEDCRHEKCVEYINNQQSKDDLKIYHRHINI